MADHCADAVLCVRSAKGYRTHEAEFQRQDAQIDGETHVRTVQPISRLFSIKKVVQIGKILLAHGRLHANTVTVRWGR